MDYMTTLLRLTLFIHCAYTAVAQFMPPFPFSGMQSGFPGNMQMPFSGGSLPMGSPVVISMGSKGKKKRKKQHKHRSSSSSSSSSASDSDSADCNHRRHGSSRLVKKKGSMKRKVLTPVVSYVTKEGYVVYQKKLKDSPDEWLNTVKKDFAEGSNEMHLIRRKKHNVK